DLARMRAGRALWRACELWPREYLWAQMKPPQDPPARLTDFRERWRVLQHSDLHYVCVLRFDEQLRELACAPFVRVLVALRREAAAAVGRAVRRTAGGAFRRLGGGSGPGFSLRSGRRGQHHA